MTNSRHNNGQMKSMIKLSFTSPSSDSSSVDTPYLGMSVTLTGKESAWDKPLRTPDIVDIGLGPGAEVGADTTAGACLAKCCSALALGRRTADGPVEAAAAAAAVAAAVAADRTGGAALVLPSMLSSCWGNLREWMSTSCCLSAMKSVI